MRKRDATAKPFEMVDIIADLEDPTRNDFLRVVEADPELRVFTLPQITVAYQVSEDSLRRHIQRGELRAVRVGRRYGVTLASWRSFLKKLEETSRITSKKFGHPGPRKKLAKKRALTASAKKTKAAMRLTTRPSKKAGGNG